MLKIFGKGKSVSALDTGGKENMFACVRTETTQLSLPSSHMGERRSWHACMVGRRYLCIGEMRICLQLKILFWQKMVSLIFEKKTVAVLVQISDGLDFQRRNLLLVQISKWKETKKERYEDGRTDGR